MSDVANGGVGGETPTGRSGIQPLEHSSSSERPSSRQDFLIVEMERRFGGRVVWREPDKSELKVEHVAWQEFAGDPLEVEPEWERFGFRGQVAKILWARGLKKKAIRFLSCTKCARPGVCKLYPLEHRYFV